MIAIYAFCSFMQVFVVLIVYRYILIRLFPFHLLLKILIEHMLKGALNFRNNTYSYFFSKSHSKNVFWDAMSIDSIVVPMDLCSRRSFHDTKVSPRAVQIRSPIRLRFSGDRGWCCLCRIRLKHEWHQYAVKKHISIFFWVFTMSHLNNFQLPSSKPSDWTTWFESRSTRGLCRVSVPAQGVVSSPFQPWVHLLVCSSGYRVHRSSRTIAHSSYILSSPFHSC